MSSENQDESNQSTTVILDVDTAEMIPLEAICRLCANQSDRIIGIYSEEGVTHKLAIKINMYLPIKITEEDMLPLQCCWSCASTVLAWHELIIGTVDADRRLKDMQLLTPKEVVETVESVEDKSKIQMTSDFEKVESEKSEEEWETQYLIIENHEYSEGQNNELSEDQNNELSEDQTNEYIDYYETVDDVDTTNIRDDNSKASRNRRRKADIEYGIFCEVCKKGYTRRSDMERHRKLKHGLTSGDEERSETDGRESLEFPCQYCNESFERKIELKVHIKTKHGVSRFRRKHNEITAEYFCDICKKGFTRKHDMKKHRKCKHPNEISAIDTEKNEKLSYLKGLKVMGPENRAYYRCDICKKMFKYAYDMLRHQTTHTKLYVFVCHICAKRFPSSSGLRRHVNQHHYGVKKFSCEICGKRFAANATLEEHMNIHTNNRPFVCDICGKAFKQKASLRSHKLFHTNDFKFACNFCDKKFRRAYELKTHTWTHTGHRPHQCPLCSSTFRLGQDLKRHLNVHDKLVECKCDECGATFSQQKYLNNHKRSHRIHPYREYKRRTTVTVADVF